VIFRVKKIYPTGGTFAPRRATHVTSPKWEAGSRLGIERSRRNEVDYGFNV
jgi:hypothetical protein